MSIERGNFTGINPEGGRPTFPKGPNGFRMVEGQELNPNNPQHMPQIVFDHLVKSVHEDGDRSATFQVFNGNNNAGLKGTAPSKLVKDVTQESKTDGEKRRKKKEEHPQKPNRLRQNINRNSFTGFWKGKFYRNGSVQ